MILRTKRLILRPWCELDAQDLYGYASDPEIGPITGWPPHQSVEESRNIIQNVLSGPEAYALCLKIDGRAIGAIELMLKGHTNKTDNDDQCELGFWIGKPFWGQGLVPEAGQEMLRRAFEDLGMTKVFCGYFDGNVKSKRVIEKLGFDYERTMQAVTVPLLNQVRTSYVMAITKEQWLALRIEKQL